MPCWVVYQDTIDKSALETKSEATSGRLNAAPPLLGIERAGI